MAKVKDEKALAKNEQAESYLATSEMPDYLRDYIGDTTGNENITTDDLTLPRLEIIQALSAARQKDDPGYIEGADEGLLYNSLTRELYGKSVIIIPVAFRKEYLLWQDLAKGGGFGGAYPSLAEAEQIRQGLENPENWEATKTHQHICYRLDPDGRVEEVAISMARSKLKVSVRFNSLIRVVAGQLPRFAMAYKLSGQKVANKQGQSYYNFAIEHAGYTPQHIFEKAVQLYDMFKDNKVGVDYSNAQDDVQGERFNGVDLGDDEM